MSFDRKVLLVDNISILVSCRDTKLWTSQAELSQFWPTNVEQIFAPCWFFGDFIRFQINVTANYRLHIDHFSVKRGRCAQE